MIAALALASGMTLTDAVRYAMAHSPQIAQQNSVVAQAEEAYVKDRSSALPNVVGSLQNIASKSSNYQGSYAAAGISQEQIFSQNTAQIGTNYTLNLGGLGFVQADAARQQVDADAAQLRRMQEQLATTVTNDFYGIALKDESVRLDQGDVGYQRTLWEIAREKVRAGVAAGVDVLRALASLQKSRSTLVSDQAAAVDARETLAQVIGAPLSTAFDVPAVVPQPPMPGQPLTQLVAIALNDRSDVLAARDQLASAQLTRRGFSRQLFPELNLFAGFGNQYSPTLAVQTQQQLTAYELANHLPLTTIPRGSPGFWQVQAVTTFQLPLVDYGARRSERTADDQALNAAQSAVDQAKGQAALDVRQAYRGAQTAKAQIAYAHDEAAAAGESARIARLQYKNGITALTDVLSAQQQSLTAAYDLYSAQVSYTEAVVQLRVATGLFDAAGAVADLQGNAQ